MRMADALVDALIALDARYVFGVSGANIEHFHDAIHRRGKGRLRSVLSRSEAGAAFMADARARVHRTMGVCCSTSGGGMMNLAVGIAEAYAGSVPLLAIVGQSAMNSSGRGAFQDSSGIGRSLDAVGMLRAISKCAVSITRAEDFWPYFKQAVIAACSDRKGPAVLLCPRDIYDAEVEPIDLDALVREIHESTRPGSVDIDDARTILWEIRAARRPVLIIGQGVRRSSDRGAVAAFARAAGIPVVTTMGARGEFDNRDPLYLGVLGVAGHPSAHEYVSTTADLLILTGASLNVMTRAPFANDPANGHERRIVAISVDAGELLRILEPHVYAPASRRSFWTASELPLSCLLQADAGAAFSTLLELWREAPFRAEPPVGYCRTYFKPELALPIDPDSPPADEGALLQSDALAILQGYMPDAGHVVFDAGNCAATALHIIDVEPGVSSTIALGMGGMGYAIAGAIGAQLGSREGTRTVVFTGDGSFMITGFEIHTAVDLRLPILFVVFNNSMHGMCVTRQQLYFDGRIESVRYPTIDVTAVARGLGGPDALWAGAARSPYELYECIEDYLLNAADRPGVLELQLTREEIPPFVPFLARDAERTPSILPSVPPPPGKPLRSTGRPCAEVCAAERKRGEVDRARTRG
jgi:acetolactate synthase-1/2/3 large subunit